MRTENDQIIFEYPGGQISFHKDLKKYIDIREMILAPRADLEKIIKTMYNAEEAKNGLRAISLRLIDFINKNLLPPLTDAGLFDLTADDFLAENSGYIKLFNSVKDFCGYSGKLSESLQNWAQNQKEKAAIQAQDSITGPGYSVISNDWLAHAVYAAKAESVVKKQIAVAQSQYDSNVQAIEETRRDFHYNEVKRTAQETFIPNILNDLAEIFEVIISKYCSCLNKCRKFEQSCLNGINPERSTAILNNLSYVSSQEGVILQAIQLCPYNLNIYSAMCDQKIPFLQVHKDILSYFGLLDVFCEYVKESCVRTGNTMSAAYSLNQYQMQQLSFLSNIEIKSAARLCLLPDFNRLLDLYAQIGLAIRRGQTLIELSRIRYPSYDGANYKEIFCNEMEKEYRSFTPNEINFCETQCDIGVLASLSLWFGMEIHSFEELNAFILQKWDNGVEIDENKKKTKEIIEEIATQKDKIQKLTEQIDIVWDGIGIPILFGLCCIFGPILLFVCNDISRDDFFSMMGEGLMGFFSTIFFLFIMGFGVWLLFVKIDCILFGKKRLQEQLKEERKKLLTMEKMKETITSQTRK